jgi:RNA recognition motif-containing protein
MQSPKSSRRIYVGRIPKDRDKKEVKALFKKIGEVVSFCCYEDEAYVEFESSNDARKAIEEVNNSHYKESNLLVEWANVKFNRSSSPPRGSNGDRGRGGVPERDLRGVKCYQCQNFGHYQRNCPDRSNRDFRGGDSYRGRGPSYRDRNFGVNRYDDRKREFSRDRDRDRDRRRDDDRDRRRDDDRRRDRDDDSVDRKRKINKRNGDGDRDRDRRRDGDRDRRRDDDRDRRRDRDDDRDRRRDDDRDRRRDRDDEKDSDRKKHRDDQNNNEKNVEKAPQNMDNQNGSYKISQNEKMNVEDKEN